MRPATDSPKRILYGVLNWGLGHATRSVPVIQQLTKAGFEVIIASDGLALNYLKKAFPLLEIRTLPGYDIHYSHSNHQLPKLALQLPKVYSAIQKENQLCKAWAKALRVSGIISDNRLGFYTAGIPSIYITHQLTMQLKYGKQLANAWHRNYYRRFSEVWLPDFPDAPTLSGALTQTTFPLQKHRFIGPLSHFSGATGFHEKKYRYAFVLSGPEPLRSRLEASLYAQRNAITEKVVLVRGTDQPLASATWSLLDSHWDVYDLLTHETLYTTLLQAEVLVARLGYSTLMDIAHLQLPAILMPTPGQSEQEYLARYHNHTAGVTIIKESELDLKKLPVKQGKPFGNREFSLDWEQLFRIFT